MRASETPTLRSKGTTVQSESRQKESRISLLTSTLKDEETCARCGAEVADHNSSSTALSSINREHEM